MTDLPATGRPNRWKRFADWDKRPLRLDNFAREDPSNGFSAFRSPADPRPGLRLEGGRVASLEPARWPFRPRLFSLRREAAYNGRSRRNEPCDA